MIEMRQLKNIDIFQIFLFLLTFSKLIEPQPAHKCLFRVYPRSIALGVGPVQIWQQEYQNNVYMSFCDFG